MCPARPCMYAGSDTRTHHRTSEQCVELPTRGSEGACVTVRSTFGWLATTAGTCARCMASAAKQAAERSGE
eukprot:2186674-Prymnesium_polylepis.1